MIRVQQHQMGSCCREVCLRHEAGLTYLHPHTTILGTESDLSLACRRMWSAEAMTDQIEQHQLGQIAKRSMSALMLQAAGGLHNPFHPNRSLICMAHHRDQLGNILMMASCSRPCPSTSPRRCEPYHAHQAAQALSCAGISHASADSHANGFMLMQSGGLYIGAGGSRPEAGELGRRSSPQ